MEAAEDEISWLLLPSMGVDLSAPLTKVYQINPIVLFFY